MSSGGPESGTLVWRDPGLSSDSWPVPVADGPPNRPSSRQERLAQRLLVALSPRLPPARPMSSSIEVGPRQPLKIQRTAAPGRLRATWFEAEGPARGAVLLAHPWFPGGQAYFLRRGRLPALRAAGYHALAFDFGGFGGAERTRYFFDTDIADALAALRERAPGLPLLLWGVSGGGMWAHALLSRQRGVAGAVFEDVPQHLLTFAKRTAPIGWPFYLFFQHVLGDAYRFLDARRHAPYLRLRAAAYVSGADDPCVRPQETRELAGLTRGEHLVIDDAGHLEPIKRAGTEVIGLALATFERALG